MTIKKEIAADIKVMDSRVFDFGKIKNEKGKLVEVSGICIDKTDKTIKFLCNDGAFVIEPSII